MRGQSAVEYIVTYGWAILALFLVVGVLMFSGVLSPNYLLTEECAAGTNFPCSFGIYNQEGETRMGMRLYNGLPYRVRIHELNISSPDGGEFELGISTPLDIESGDPVEFEGVYLGLGDLDQLPENSYERFVLHIEYASCAPELIEPGDDCSQSIHVINARVAGRVIPEET